jgi:hypothetical protein
VHTARQHVAQGDGLLPALEVAHKVVRLPRLLAHYRCFDLVQVDELDYLCDLVVSAAYALTPLNTRANLPCGHLASFEISMKGEAA